MILLTGDLSERGGSPLVVGSLPEGRVFMAVAWGGPGPLGTGAGGRRGRDRGL